MGGSNQKEQKEEIYIQCPLNKHFRQDSFYMMGLNDKNLRKMLQFETTKKQLQYSQFPQNFQMFNDMGICQDGYKIYFSGGINSDQTNISNFCGYYDTQTNKIIHLLTLQTPRYGHQMVYFKQKLYVIGGKTYGKDLKNSLLKSTEIYDLDNQKVIDPVNMKKPRVNFNSFIYKDQLYVCGGYTGEAKFSRKIEMFNHKKSKWEVYSKFKIVEGVERGVLVASNFLPDQFFIIGGVTKMGVSSNIQVNNFRTQQSDFFSEKMNIKRFGHKYYINTKGEIVIFGGDETGKISCEIASVKDFKFNIIQVNSFLFNNEEFADIHSDNFRTFSTSNVINYVYSEKDIKQQKIENEKIQKFSKDPEIFMFGTFENPFIYKINIGNNKFKKLKIPEQMTLYSFQGYVKLDSYGNFFITGGITDDFTESVNNTYIYDSQNQKVEVLQQMSTRRYNFTIIKKDWYIYVMGGRGQGDKNILISCERFNLLDKKWETIAPLNKNRCSASALVINDKLYIAGGYNGNQDREVSFEVYNEQKNTWEMMGIELKQGLEGSHLLSINQKLLFLGGRNNQGDTNQCQIYDISNGFDIFINQDGGSMETQRSLHKVIQVSENRFLVFGGFSVVDCVEGIYFNEKTNMIEQDKKSKHLVNNFTNLLLKQEFIKNFDFQQIMII